ncbi:MAG: phosphoribosylamine--glycine ligase [Ignavibacteriae bacterium]|nr:phosphoribosylamine--glycine ligase [Ignavibacteriota bacterium]
MNILLIGSGGREHALALALSRSKELENLYAAPANPGILQVAKLAPISINDHNAIAEFCKDKHIDFVVIGPEQPLEAGLSDSLRSNGIVVFGPSKQAAMLETSKSFAKEFMVRHNIPTASFKRFTAIQQTQAIEYVHQHHLPVVIKADGLAAGKGVIVAETIFDAESAIKDILGGAFGSAGAEVVVEDFLKGEEASIFAICDGTNFLTLAPAQDHKRVFDGDKGKNTGGMGAFAPAAIVTDDVLKKVKERIITPTLSGMTEEGAPFIGCLFVGLMIDNGDPSVVEFNCRFGDPETQAVLSITDGDFADLFFSAALGLLHPGAITNIYNGYACNVVLASGGYPDTYKTGYPIAGISEAEETGVTVFHAGTKIESSTLVTNGGRVLGVCGKGETLSEAIKNAYNGVNFIKFTDEYHRTDIGHKSL